MAKLNKIDTEDIRMTYDEFLKEYEVGDSKWKFDLFKIVCKKCGSERVEFNSDMEKETGYYNEVDITGNIVVKCLDCGNAFTLDFGDLGKD